MCQSCAIVLSSSSLLFWFLCLQRLRVTGCVQMKRLELFSVSFRAASSTVMQENGRWGEFSLKSVRYILVITACEGRVTGCVLDYVGVSFIFHVLLRPHHHAFFLFFFRYFHVVWFQRLRVPGCMLDWISFISISCIALSTPSLYFMCLSLWFLSICFWFVLL